MDDRDIVAAMRGEDAAAGLASAYDAYAGKLHAYCWTLLHDHDAAADAVQDTFIVAGRCIDQLRDPDRLRPWLYSIARNECLRQLRSAARSAPLDEAGDVMDEAAPEAEQGLRQDETRDLVWSAAQGLNPGEYEVLELHLRHELEGADLAAALGVTRNHAHALLSRARAQFEVSLSALLVARTGRENCPELDALLADWDGSITVLLRKRINRHIEHCDICGERKKRELQPALLLSALPFVLAPATLRDKLFKLVSDPRMEGYRRMVADRAAPFGPDGFVKPLDGGAGTSGPTGNSQGDGPGDGGDGGGGGGTGGSGGGDPENVDAADDFSVRKHAKKAALLALLLVLLVGAGAVVTVKTVFAAPTAAGSSTPTASAEGVTSSLAAPPIIIASPTPSASPSPSPSPSASPSPSPSQVVIATSKAATAPKSSPAPPPTSASPSPPPPPTLVATPNPVNMSYDETGEEATFTVSVSNGTLKTLTIFSPNTTYLNTSFRQNANGTSVSVTAYSSYNYSPQGDAGPIDLTISSTDGATSITVPVYWEYTVIQ